MRRSISAANQQRGVTKRNPTENWFAKRLEAALGKKYISRQKLFHYRVFDFFIKLKGVAIEVDGKAYHDREKDLARDRRYEKRFGIKIFRVWAFDEADASRIIGEVKRIKILLDKKEKTGKKKEVLVKTDLGEGGQEEKITQCTLVETEEKKKSPKVVRIRGGVRTTISTA